jgi:hypothetical protein
MNFLFNTTGRFGECAVHTKAKKKHFTHASPNAVCYISSMDSPQIANTKCVHMGVMHHTIENLSISRYASEHL